MKLKSVRGRNLLWLSLTIVLIVSMVMVGPSAASPTYDAQLWGWKARARPPGPQPVGTPRELQAWVKNTGTADTWVKVVFAIVDATGIPVAIPETDPVWVLASNTHGGSGNYFVLWTPTLVGKYYIRAQCFYDSDGNLATVDWVGTNIKTFSVMAIP